MADVAAGIKDLLVTAGVGTFGAASGWSIFIEHMPDSPDTSICIYHGPGLTPNPKWAVDYPGIQIIVRGAEGGYVAFRQKAQDVKDVLLGLPSQDLNGDRWVGIWSQGDLASMGVDEKKRPKFSLNFNLIIEPADNALTNREQL